MIKQVYSYNSFLFFNRVGNFTNFLANSCDKKKFKCIRIKF